MHGLNEMVNNWEKIIKIEIKSEIEIKIKIEFKIKTKIVSNKKIFFFFSHLLSPNKNYSKIISIMLSYKL